MEKVFKCSVDEQNEIKTNKFNKCILVEVKNKEYETTELIFLSKTDAIEFCRELLKHIASL
jgi:hypothetical protein